MFASEIECPNIPSEGLFSDCSENIYSCDLIDIYFANESCNNGVDCDDDCVDFSCEIWGFDGATCSTGWDGVLGISGFNCPENFL